MIYYFEWGDGEITNQILLWNFPFRLWFGLGFRLWLGLEFGLEFGYGFELGFGPGFEGEFGFMNFGHFVLSSYLLNCVS